MNERIRGRRRVQAEESALKTRILADRNQKNARAKRKQKFIKVMKAIMGLVVACVAFNLYAPESKGAPYEAAGAEVEVTEKQVKTLHILEDKGQTALLDGQFQKADKLYAKMIAIKPNHADALYVRGIIRSTSEDREVLLEGEKFFKRAIKVNNKRSDYYSGLAEVMNALGNRKGALHAYQKTIKLLGKKIHPNTYNDLALIYMEMKQYDEARKLLTTALSAAPQHSEVLNNYGKLERELGNYEEALGWFSQAIDSKDNYAIAHMNIGTLFANMKDRDNAIKHLRKALEIDPQNRDIAQAKFILKVLESDKGILDSEEMDEELERNMKQHTETMFDDYASDFDRHVEKHLEYRVPYVIYHKLLDSYELKSGLRILDLGAGTGLIGKALVGFTRSEEGAGGAMYGSDISSKMVAEARKKKVYTTLWAEDCLLTLERFRHQPVDVITAGDVFGYIGDLNPIFEKIGKTLVFGGSFVFSTEACEECTTYSINTQTMRVRHAKKYILELVEKHGYDLIDSEKTWGRTESGKRVQMEVYVLSPNPMQEEMKIL